MTNPWLSPDIATQQRALVDAQLQQSPPRPHFQALASAVRATQCPGELLFIGSGVGHEREILDRAGVPYRSFAGIDISPEAIRLAKERYPESTWAHGEFPKWQPIAQADVVVDSACVMHVDEWRAHLAALCRSSRRWVILHRVPVSQVTSVERFETEGYGHSFPALRFDLRVLCSEVLSLGLDHVATIDADGDSKTLVFAKKRHYVSYSDSAYLSRLRALHASMVRHCGPFMLHVLAWDQGVADWCATAPSVSYSHIDDFLKDVPSLQLEALPGPPRTRVEHMWTVGGRWLLEIMEETGQPVCYCDSDIMFFSSPEPVFAEIGGAPAAVVPHGFARAAQGLPGPTRESHGVFGTYNCGLLYVADRVFAERWAEKCRAWCYDRVEGFMRSELGPGHMIDVEHFLYGDQVYLNSWAEQSKYFPMYEKPWPNGPAHVVQHPGACCGPWQVHCRSWDVRDGVIHFGNRPLVSYHFSGYRELPEGHTVCTRPEYMLSRRQEELIYGPYVRALEEAKR